MLRDFLATQRDAIIARAVRGLAATGSDGGKHAEHAGGSLFVDQVIEALRFTPVSFEALDAIGRSAVALGAQRQCDGLSLADVVHEYANVGRAILELAGEAGLPIAANELQALHRCLDEATARAVTEHALQHERVLAGEERERAGELAHELRGSIGSAMISFDLLRGGSAGFAGGTAGVLGRSLGRLSSLVEASVASVRLGAGIRARERVPMRQFIEEVEAAAVLEASTRGLTLGVLPVEQGMTVEADRPLLSIAVTNLLANAFKFTRPKGHVLLRTSSARGRVLIDVEDECGGLPPGKAETLFQPFEQRSENRSGLGLGLSLSRRGVEANGGWMRVRDVPGSGCVFTIDLPRVPG